MYDINTFQFATVDFWQVEEEIVLIFSSSTCSRRDIILMALISDSDGLSPGKLRRTGYNRCNLRSHLQDIFLPAHITRFHIQECRLAGAFSIASGGTTFARMLSVGKRRHSGYIGYRVPLSNGYLFGDIAFFPARGAHRPGPSGGSAETGRASPSPASIAALRFSRNQERHRKPLAVDWRLRINWLQWNFFYGFTCQRQSCQLRSTRSWPLLL